MRAIRAMFGLGFSSGIPFLLVYVTQSAWLSEAKVPLAIIGMMSELTLAYKFKFVWAPFMDQYDAPVFSRLLGRRRGWIVTSQIGVALALIGVAFGDPAHWLAWTIFFSLALGFAGATQDIVIDGWRITVAPPEHAGLMSSWSEIGWRIGGFVSGAGALYIADAFGWRAAYLSMAACMLPGMIAALLAPEPPSDLRPHPKHDGFVGTIVAPIKELLTRLGTMGIPILLLVAGFRMPGYVSSAMAMPLFKHLHYSDSDIATVTKLFGFWVALAGTFTAGIIITRFGIMATFSLAPSSRRPRISRSPISRLTAATGMISGFLPRPSASTVSPMPSLRSCSSPICRRSPRRSMPRANMRCSPRSALCPAACSPERPASSSSGRISPGSSSRHR